MALAGGEIAVMVSRIFNNIAAILLIIVFSAVYGYSADLSGRVVDALTGKAVEDAVVTSQDNVVHTDREGRFQVGVTGDTIGIRAYGYLRKDLRVSSLTAGIQDIQIKPFTPKALYLSFYGIGDRGLRESALRLIDETELNSLVIDVKGDRGMIPYKSSVPLAVAIGAQKITTVKEIRGLIGYLHQKGVYLIARIVVFKDNPLAFSRPDLAIRTQSGQTWLDREGLAWTDPFKREVWDYNIDIAVEAARNGFDEIQFDYVRLPDESGLKFAMPNTEQTRINAITGFLSEARRRLKRYNVFLAADIFGYVCWNLDDTDIGQRLEDLPLHLDYISPMLYPSGFQYGIPGHRIPVVNPYAVVRLSLERAKQRTGLPAKRFRPWLQAFKDYAFDRRPFKDKEIREQIRAAEGFGSDGWMLWNPRNVYSDDGLKK